ncbi:LytTR family DNA-binding domain-containing protein [Novosphingobium ginsenosidimutans]|nr:LytTR family DNA-binding domain-containing protein [Novosphingobium ginsenosidimutans]
MTAMAYGAFGLVYVIVNATTLIDQREALGRPIDPWQAWLLEITSFLAWFILLPFILWLANRLLRIRPMTVVIAIHAVACAALSLAHTLLMLGLRLASFAIAGERYAPTDSPGGMLLFEFRKDLITYAALMLVFHVSRRLVADRIPDSIVDPAGVLIEVRDGSRTIWIKPDEVDWVSAAGNYVELHGSFGAQLMRRKLGDLEAELQRQGFARVHRSRLVRQASIASIETRQSGDFDILMRSGDRISGSRRFRTNIKGA